METSTLTRLQLYELVWQRPRHQVAKQLGISPERLAGACRRLQIPLPARGYWQQRAAGHPVIPLPLTQGPDLMVGITVHSAATPGTGIPIRIARISTSMPGEPALTMSKLSNPHPLVVQARHQLQGQAADLYGLRKASPIAGLSVRVSEVTETRALAIVDTIFRSPAKAGVKFGPEPGAHGRGRGNCGFSVDGHAVQLSIREKYTCQRKTDSERNKEYAAGRGWVARVVGVPTGILTLTISHRLSRYQAEWTDHAFPLKRKSGPSYEPCRD